MPNLYYDLPIDIKEIIDEKVHKLKFAEVMKEVESKTIKRVILRLEVRGIELYKQRYNEILERYENTISPLLKFRKKPKVMDTLDTIDKSINERYTYILANFSDIITFH